LSLIKLIEASFFRCSGAAELQSRLEEFFDIPLTAALVFEYPTMDALASYIVGRTAPKRTKAESPPSHDITIEYNQVLATLIGLLRASTGSLEVPLDTPLLALGLDSLSAVELRHELSKAFNLRLSTTIVFDYPTASSMAAFIHSLLQTQNVEVNGEFADGIAAFTTSPVQTRPYADEISAWHGGSQYGNIVCIENIIHRVAAPSTETTFMEFAAKDTCAVVPFLRWDVESSVQGIPHRPGSRFGRFLSDIELFDAAAFGMAPSEAMVLDPQQRLMLEVRVSMRCFPVALHFSI